MRALGEKAIRLALILNGGFLIIEAVAGWWTQSLALLSDAGHMLSDVAALAIALFGARLARRPPSDAYTFGLRRAPVVAALINAMSLLAIVVWICIEAFERFQHPTAIHADAVIGVGLIGLFVNVISAWFLQRSGDHSVNARAAMLHLAADALGSVAAVVAGLFAKFADWTMADPIVSVLIALLIAVATIPLTRQALGIVLQRAPAFLEELRETLSRHPQIAAVSDLHIWELDDGEAILSARLEPTETLSLVEANTLADSLRKELEARFHIAHATLEMRCGAAPPVPCESIPTDTPDAH